MRCPQDIANVRTHWNEQRVRADREALVETSPVGVAVFDARTGNPVSFNQEAKRIVEGLHTPGHPPRATPGGDNVPVRRRREVSLQKFPLSQHLSTARTMRAEEIVISVPDGRRVTTLINAKPIHAVNGEVESVVVTLQDLAAIEELERLRAEFLGMVSHELRTPLTSIKGSTTTVLGASPVLDPTEMLQFFRIIADQADHMHGLIGDLLDVGRIEAGTLSVSPEPSAVAAMVHQARNTFLSGRGRHTVRLDLPPELPRVMADSRRIVQVLNNLLSNAARQSPESAPIRVAAARDGVHVAISVSDEGKGVPADLLPHLFRKHGAGGDREPGLGGYGPTGGTPGSWRSCTGRDC